MFNHGVRGRRGGDNSGMVTLSAGFIETKNPELIINGYFVSGQADKALDPAGGQTVLITGGGFTSGITGTLGGVAISPITYISPTQVSFTSPAKTGGLYVLVLTNTSGSTGAIVPGITYSSIPTFTTSAGSIGTVYETTQYSKSVVATSDSTVTYALTSGSLPPDATLNASTGAITGNAPVINSGSNTYSFSITATDNESQSVTRSFTITESIDILTWTNPSTSVSSTIDSSPYSLTLSATDAAGYTPSYNVDTLPSGLSLSSNIISGTPTVDGQTLTSTVTASSSTTSRYSNISIAWTVSFGDLNWPNTTLLLSASNTVQTNSFMFDNSLSNQQLTPTGSVRAQSFNPYQVGYYSNYFDGSTGYLSIPTNSALSWIGTNNGFIECWVYPTVASQTTSIVTKSDVSGTSYPNWSFVLSSGKAQLYVGNSGAPGSTITSVTGSTTIPLNTWTHLAGSRNYVGGGSVNVYIVYVNGVVDGSSTGASPTDGAPTALTLGRSQGASNYFSGYMSNLRMSNTTIPSGYQTGSVVTTIASGSAPSSGTLVFTPSTSPLTAITGTSLLTFQSLIFTDSSTNNFTITANGTTKVTSSNPFTLPSSITVNTGYSTYFNGSTDFLTIPSNSGFNLTGSFTVETWLYLSANPAVNSGSSTTGTVCAYGVASSTNTGYEFDVTTGASGQILFNKLGTGTGIQCNYIFSLNTWYHIAITYNGSTGAIYVNGVSQTLTGNTWGWSAPPTPGFFIARGVGYSGYLDYFPGYISNFRIVNGSVVYTSNFTPSTTPLTAITNTSLLTCQGSMIADYSTNAFAITTNGTPKVLNNNYPFTQTTATVSSISTLGGGYFDGSTGYLTAPNTNNLTFGTGDFSIEFWVYHTSIPVSYTYVDTRPSGSNGNYLTFGYNNTPNGLFLYGQSTMLISTGITPTSNIWNHLVLNRISSTSRIYLNGILIGSASDGTNYGVGAVGFVVGANSIGVGNYMPGYISNFRVIKGSSIYTSNFAPPTSPLTAISNTQLLTLQSNGAHNSDTFNDNSSFNSNNQITRNGNANAGAFSPYGDNWSNYFSASGNYLYQTSSNFNVGATGTPFTVECWVYLLVNTNFVVVGNGGAYGNGFIIGYSNGAFAFSQSPGGAGGFLITTAANYSLYTWYHVALVRNASNLVTLYINGVSAATGTNGSGAVSSSTLVLNGLYDNNGLGNSGGSLYMSNLRWLSGVALYTTAFTPPTAPLTAITGTVLLTCQSNRFVDNSVSNGTLSIGGTPTVQKFSPFASVTVPKYYSTYFNGSTDYLSIPHNAALNLSSATAFTIEAWVYWNGSNANANIIEKDGVSGTSYIQYGLQVNGSGYVQMMLGSGNGISSLQTVPSSTLLPTNTWVHIAFVLNGGNLYLYQNGVQVASAAKTATMVDGGKALLIGYQSGQTSSNYFGGYISNARLVNGTAVYTSAFTPSTSPLTAITNTSLLTCQSNTFIDNSTNNFTITVATTTVKPLPVSPFTSTISAKTNYSSSTFGGSINFNGSTGYVTFPLGSGNQFGTGNFTIEFWSYFIARDTNGSSLVNNYTTFTTGSLGIFAGHISGTTTLYQVSYNGSGFPNLQSTTTIQYNQWAHIALVRNGTTITLFINGINNGTITSASAALNGTGNWTVGTAGDSPTTYHTNGYISDLRITNGVALYTSNFVPSFSPLSSISYINNSTTLSNTAYAGLLLNGTSTAISDATRSVDLESLGTARVTSFSPYNGSYYSTIYGSGNYWQAPQSTNWDIWGANCTVEMWVYLTSYTGDSYQGVYLVGNYTGANGASGWNVGLTYGATPTLGITYWNGAGGTSIGYSGTAVTLNQWVHLSATRSGSTIYFYVNGVYQSSVAAPTIAAGDKLTSGAYVQNFTYPSYVYGYISNLRIIKGTALYSGTGSFTVPTTPLTAIANTVFLGDQSNRFVDNGPNNVTITLSGTPKVQTQNPWQANTGLSYYLDGSSYLASPLTQNYDFGTGDFTIEFWMNSVASGTYVAVVGTQSIAGNTTAGMWRVTTRLNSVNGIYFNYSTGSAFTDVTFTTTSYNDNSWHYVAIVRASNVLKAYVDGTQVGSNTSITQSLSSGQKLYVGFQAQDSVYYQGYVSDLRITKGVARYTSTTFIPPSGPRQLK